MRSIAAILLATTALSAPFQCPSEPDPDKRREETPGEALYDLAQEFGKAGDRDAKIRTLEYLVKKHPRSRHAVMAHEELEAMGVSVPDPRETPEPPRTKPSASAAAPATASASASAREK